MPDYLIAYDITCPKRLNRLHRYLMKIAMPIQYSGFFLTTDERNLESLMQGAQALIDPKTDDLRCYPLPARGLRQRLGRAALPAGILWTGLPAQWQTEDISPGAAKTRQSPLQQIDFSDKIRTAQ
jgi:CRISPR-associated endonuclease Cas2